MKNKVLRLAIVAVLVVAMVLSMAACNDPKPVVTETPTPVVTPTPTKTPDKTPAPTPTPVVPSDAGDTALAKATYGIELKAQDFTYGVIANKDDATERYSDVIVEFDSDLLQNYVALTKDFKEAKPYIKWAVSYEGEGAYKAPTTITWNTNGLMATVAPDKAAYYYETYTDLAGKTRARLVLTKDAPAGVYTVTATITVEDNGFLFGRFGKIKEEKVVYELTTIVNVAKADLTIKTPSYVAPVEKLADGVSSKAPIAPAYNVKLEPAGDGIDPKDFTAEQALYAALKAAYGDNYKFFLRAGSMIDTTKVGSYEILVSAHNKTVADDGAKEENVVPFAEMVAVNHNVTFENGKQYFVDAYDWNAIRDVATSILEMGTPAELNKVKLARARYDALTEAQKAFFATGIVAAAPAALTYKNQTTVGAFKGATTPAADVELITALTKGKEIYKLLTEAEKTAKQDAVVEAWDKVVKDAKFLTYAELATADKKASEKLSGFNIENATHVASYNAVKTYFDALSDAEKDIIKATFTWDDTTVVTGCTASDKKYQDGEAITSENGYTAFFLVSGLFDVKAAQEVKTLIAAAAAAYNRAVKNNVGKYIYEDKLEGSTPTVGTGLDGKTLAENDNYYGGVAFYLNNAEVVAVTNQANAAYDKLTKSQKKLLEVDVAEDASVANVKKNFDKDSWTYKTVLASLKTMNEVVGYMEQVINHTKIEDLAHNSTKTPAYDSLNKIVYGKVGALKGNYLTGTDLQDDVADFDRTKFNAVSDILRAYAKDSASLDAVVAEYKAMVDYVLAGEAYKAEQIAALNALIATEFVAENHTDAEIAVATASTNPVLTKLALAITKEIDPTITAVAGSKTYATQQRIVNGSVKAILSKKGLESYDEAKAAFEGLFNVDKAMSVFNVIYKNTEAANATGATEGKFFFAFA